MSGEIPRSIHDCHCGIIPGGVSERITGGFPDEFLVGNHVGIPVMELLEVCNVLNTGRILSSIPL